MVYSIYSISVWVECYKEQPFPGGHATQARKFVFSAIPKNNEDSDHRIHNKIGQIGAIGTGMTTIMHSRLAVQAADRVLR
jgi:hypothetical protein